MISKEKFLKYYTIQKSGKYNMFFEAKEYKDTIGCTLEEIFDIMSNYAKYYDLYIKSPATENIKEDSSEPSNSGQVSVKILSSDFIDQYVKLKSCGKYAFAPDLQVREKQIFAVGITYGWSMEGETIDAAYECIGSLISPGLNPQDVVEVVYDEDSSDCRSIEFFGGVVQAIPIVFRSLPGYNFQIDFD